MQCEGRPGECWERLLQAVAPAQAHRARASARLLAEPMHARYMYGCDAHAIAGRAGLAEAPAVHRG